MWVIGCGCVCSAYAWDRGDHQRRNAQVGIFQNYVGDRVTWVAQWLSICLLLRTWSQGPGMESHIQLLAGSLLLSLPMSLPFSVCPSWINKLLFLIKESLQRRRAYFHPSQKQGILAISKDILLGQNCKQCPVLVTSQTHNVERKCTSITVLAEVKPEKQPEPWMLRLATRQ